MTKKQWENFIKDAENMTLERAVELTTLFMIDNNKWLSPDICSALRLLIRECDKSGNIG